MDLSNFSILPIPAPQSKTEFLEKLGLSFTKDSKKLNENLEKAKTPLIKLNYPDSPGVSNVKNEIFNNGSGSEPILRTSKSMAGIQ